MRRFQFSLGGMLAFTALCAVTLGLALTIPAEAWAYLSRFVYSCMVLLAALAVTCPADFVLRRMPIPVAILAIAAGYLVLTAAFRLLGGVIEQYHVFYAVGLARRAADSVQLGARGRVPPPELAFETCIMGWVLLWIVDCLSRTRRSSVWVPIAFFLFVVLAMPATPMARE